MKTAGLALVLLCLVAVPAAAADSACDRKITVVGRAQASHVPDYIALTMASESKAANVAGALDASAKSVAGIVTLARDLGVPAGDVRTVSVVLETATRTVTRTLASNQQEPDGYRVNNRVRVRLVDRSRAGELVRRILEIGGLQIEAVDLGLEDAAKTEAALLVLAAKHARAQAAALAEAAGAGAGVLCSLTASKMQQTPRMSEPEGPSRKYDSSKSYDGLGGGPRLFVPLESGTIDLVAEVTADFAAQP